MYRIYTELFELPVLLFYRLFFLNWNASLKKWFFVKSLHKMVSPTRPPFMKSLFIYFFRPFFERKKDDFEGYLKGADGCFKGVWWVLQGVWSVFEGCLEK